MRGTDLSYRDYLQFVNPPALGNGAGRTKEVNREPHEPHEQGRKKLDLSMAEAVTFALEDKPAAAEPDVAMGATPRPGSWYGKRQPCAPKSGGKRGKKGGGLRGLG